jgi:hypothetical protein
LVVFSFMASISISELSTDLLPSSPIATINSLFVDSFAAQSPQVCFSSSISVFSSASQLNFSSPISTSAKKIRTLLFAWWTLECCYWFCCYWTL